MNCVPLRTKTLLKGFCSNLHEQYHGNHMFWEYNGNLFSDHMHNQSQSLNSNLYRYFELHNRTGLNLKKKIASVEQRNFMVDFEDCYFDSSYRWLATLIRYLNRVKIKYCIKVIKSRCQPKYSRLNFYVNMPITKADKAFLRLVENVSTTLLKNVFLLHRVKCEIKSIRSTDSKWGLFVSRSNCLDTD